MFFSSSILIVLSFICIPAVAFASDSNAYVLLGENPNGSITPLDPENGSLAASYFVPAGGVSITVAPGSGEIWEVVSVDGAIPSIAILDPKSGATLATIAPGLYFQSLIFDPTGKYVYVAAEAVLLKIDVSSRQIIQQAASSTFSPDSLLACSSDDSRLFVTTSAGSLEVLNSASLRILSSIPVPSHPSSMLVFGSTLLVSGGTQLLYFDTATLQQTNSAVVPQESILFGVTGSEIYVYTQNYSASEQIMEILDFSSGAVLVSRQFSNVGLLRVLLSPDGEQIVVGQNPVLLLDADTLATTDTIFPMGTVVGDAYLNAQTVLLLNYAFDGGGAVAVIDQATAQVTATFPIGFSAVPGATALADPNLGLIWMGGYESYLNAASAKVNQVVKSFSPYNFAPGARVGSVIYGSNYDVAMAFNLATGELETLPAILELGTNYFVTISPGLATPSGAAYWTPFSYIYTGGGDAAFQSEICGIGIYSTASNALSARLFSKGCDSRSFVFGPNNFTAYIARTNAIALYETRTLQNTQTFPCSTTFTALAISPDGSTLYGTDDTAIYVLDAATGVQTNLFPITSVPPADPGAMALSPDGSTLFLTDFDDKLVYLIDTTSGEVRQVPVGSYPTSVAVLASK